MIKEYLSVEGLPALRWHSENRAKLPKKCITVDDSLSADEALKLARSGTALLWQGDFINAKQLLSAMSRKIDKKKPKIASSAKEQFNLYRLTQAQKAQVLGMLLIPVNADKCIPLKRAPRIEAVIEGILVYNEAFVLSLRELLGLIGAYEWRKNGVPVPVLGEQAKIYPYYGVFSPVRGEYLDLVAQAPLPPSAQIAVDIGCGTGVLSAILAKRDISKVIATDISPRAIACACFNHEQLGLSDAIKVLEQAFFPDIQADIIVCNPPWLPAKANTTLEAAVYDPDSAMLRGFLNGLKNHLTEYGEGWLIISDLAEHLDLRSREQLLAWIEEAGLSVKTRYDTRPKHKKAFDARDPLSQARQQEITSLWVLTPQ